MFSLNSTAQCARMLRDRSSQLGDIGAQVKRRGIKAGVAKHLRNRRQRTTVLQQRGCEPGSEHVGILAAPWPMLRRMPNAIVTSSTAQRAASVRGGD